MKKSIGFLIFGIVFILSGTSYGQSVQHMDIKTVAEFSLGSKIGSLRAVPVKMGKGESAILMIYSADKDIDPWIEMFYPPTDRLKFALFALDGRLLWKKELGSSTINGTWFTPVFPFDLDEDGVDEIYFVNNIDEVHLLSYDQLRLEVLDAKSGKSIGQWPWKRSVFAESNSHTYRNFILGGFANDEPVLVTGQGTYQRMGLQGWNSDMVARWDLIIEDDHIGARGSHMSPVVDINYDRIDEILWGERCISIDDGHYLFIADKMEYNEHSDVIQPTLDRETGKWSIFTCREGGSRGKIKPRVVMFDDEGKRIWSDLEEGHMDMGWTAHVGPDSPFILAFTISMGGKIAGPDGFFRTEVKEYAYDGQTGRKIKLNFKAYNTTPVDMNGDGFHEFACARGEQADRKIYDFQGNVLADLGESAYLAMASKFMNLPGEQILCYYPDGTIKIWADKNAKDSEIAIKRYRSPYYMLAQKLTASGSNKVNLGGL